MYLNAHTYYSLRYGTLGPFELAHQAAQCGVTTLVLTDINNTSCSFDFIRACEQEGIRPVLGIEFRQEGKLLYLGIAKNNAGFRALNAHLSTHSLAQKPLSALAPPFTDVFVVYPQSPKPLEALREYEYIG
ncbi:MAG: PHP domain-containing protein, partial [Bacteroidota bacterium]